ncbi:hypothetical protein [Bacillus phage YungSlug]|nr:hypothetical protein [Bacillus phage YungSlug]
MIQKGSKPYVMGHIRLQSAAGWYLGSVEFLNGEVQPYDKDDGYYPSESFLKSIYPRSISFGEALAKAKLMGRYKEE